MKKRVAGVVLLGIVTGWVVGAAALLITVELTDGKAFDSTWLSS